MMVQLLKYPYPFKAWLALSNDPDHTTYERWLVLHKLIWEDLGIPFADSLFIYSFNQYLPNQINLVDKKEDLLKHTYDTIHSWGDFRHSGMRSFVRSDAEAAKVLLEKYKITPRVWTDHSSFEGNFMHNNTNGAQPAYCDAAGHTYINQKYSLDIAYNLGVRYIWDGKLTSNISDVWYSKIGCGFRNSIVRSSAKTMSKLFPEFKFHIDDNFDLNRRLYKCKEFEGGYKLYIFRRYGTWRKADIEGLGDLLSEDFLRKLINKEGAVIIYTHLGKRNANVEQKAFTISDNTRVALKRLKDLYSDKRVNLSSVSEMLDYAVIRDNVKIANNRLDFSNDGIRYKVLEKSDLAGKVFSFTMNNGQVNSISVFLEGTEINNYKIKKENDGVFSLVFS